MFHELSSQGLLQERGVWQPERGGAREPGRLRDGGRGLPGAPRAQPVWSRVRRGASASELGLRQQTAGAPHRPRRSRARGSPPWAALGGGFERQHPWGAGGCPMEQRPRHSRASRIQRWMVCKQGSSTYSPLGEAPLRERVTRRAHPTL